jgi:hypothetical protein
VSAPARAQKNIELKEENVIKVSAPSISIFQLITVACKTR